MPKSSLLLKIFISFSIVLTCVNLILVLHQNKISNPLLFPSLTKFIKLPNYSSFQDLSDISTPKIFSQNFEYNSNQHSFTKLNSFVKNSSGKLILNTSDTLIQANVQNNFFQPSIQILDTKDPLLKNLYISEIFDTSKSGYFRNTNLTLPKNLTHIIRTVIDNSLFEGNLSTLSITQLDITSNKSDVNLTLPNTLSSLNLDFTQSSIKLKISSTNKIKIISDHDLTLEKFDQISPQEYVYNLAENESPDILIKFTSNQSSNLQITLY